VVVVVEVVVVVGVVVVVVGVVVVVVGVVVVVLVVVVGVVVVVVVVVGINSQVTSSPTVLSRYPVAHASHLFLYKGSHLSELGVPFIQ